MLPRNTHVLAIVAGLALSSVYAAAPATQPAGVDMEKYVSKEATFVLYKPKGWKVSEGGQAGFRTIIITDPAGSGQAGMYYGKNPVGQDVVALLKVFLGATGQSYPDLTITRADASEDKHRVAVRSTFTRPDMGPREFRCWISGTGDEFVFTGIEAAKGKMAKTRPLLLTILSNIRVFKGAFASGPPVVQLPPLVQHELSDGSARFLLPQGWGCKELGKAGFIAADPAGQYAFLVASVDVLTPQLNVTVPGVPVAPYQSPSRAMKMLGEWQGSATNLTFEKVIPREDVAQQMAQVYTAGPVTVEEFIYTCDTKAGRSKGYSFGFTFGSRINAGWNFRHLTVMAPADKFDGVLGTFIRMLDSYRIDDEWAKTYVQQGLIRLRQLQQQTAAIVARNAQEIHDMMQAAYDERQRSMDYIDYQRSNYIRGEQDWISGMEGGTVYHTDTWGTRNTVTGESWEGKPYDYVNFEGDNPRHNETMTPIDSRALWERHIAR
jgi:hypothetical protein